MILILVKKLTWWTQYQICNLLISDLNPTEEIISGISLTLKLASSYILHQDPKIKHLSAYKGTTDPLNIKVQYHDKPDKKTTCILCKYYKVYNVLYHNFVSSMYTGKHTSHPNNYKDPTGINEKRPHVPTYISYDSV